MRIIKRTKLSMKWFITEKTKQEKITTLWLNKETSFIQSYMHIVDIQRAWLTMSPLPQINSHVVLIMFFCIFILKHFVNDLCFQLSHPSVFSDWRFLFCSTSLFHGLLYPIPRTSTFVLHSSLNSREIFTRFTDASKSHAGHDQDDD